jgi:predicted acylesterase/phospholipase RssA
MIDAVAISGGGMRGLTLLGALSTLQLDTCKVFCGTSIGSIAAALGSLRYDIEDIVMTKLIPFTFQTNFNILGLDSQCGVDTGLGLRKLIETLFPEPVTFKYIYDRHGTTLVVCATNVNLRKPTYFSVKTHPDMDIRRALVASCSVPFLFRSPVIDDHRYTDGGLTDNFPLEICSEFLAKNRRKSVVVGLKLSRQPCQPSGFNEYIAGILDILVDSYPHNKTLEIRHRNRVMYAVIHIQLPDQWTMEDGDITSLIVNPINFKLDKTLRYELFRFGKHFTSNHVSLSKKIL